MSGVLAVVTSTPQVSVAIGDAGEVAEASLVLRQGRRHGEVLAPAIQSLCRLAGVDLESIGSIAVDTGPGLFTGLRVGVATAKALASALGIPVVTASSLDLLAYPHRGERRPVCSVVDARRGEVFWARYEAGTCVGDPLVVPPDVLASEVAGTGALLTGDGARRYADLLAPAGSGVAVADPAHDHPLAAVLVELAASRPALSPEKVTPTYLRNADVRIGWETRGD